MTMLVGSIRDLSQDKYMIHNIVGYIVELYKFSLPNKRTYSNQTLDISRIANSIRGANGSN